MNKNLKFFKVLLSGFSFALFVFLAVASGEENSGGSSGYTPTRIEENPETDFSSDITEDEREEEEEYISDSEEYDNESYDTSEQEEVDTIE